MSLPPPSTDHQSGSSMRRPRWGALSRRKTWLNIALGIIGGALLVVTIRRVGWVEVQGGLAQVGWWFLLVVLLGGLRFGARARAWMACVEAITHSALRTGTTHSVPSARTPHSALRTGTPPASARVDDTRELRRGLAEAADGGVGGHSALRTQHFFNTMLAADALGNLTPLGLLASEPAKILLMRARISTVVAIVSVAAENAFYMATVVAMLAAGAAVFINLIDLPANLRLGVQTVLAVAVLSGVMALVAARRRPAVLSRLAHMLSAVSGRGRTSAGHLEEVEARFYDILTWPAHRLARVLTWDAVFHVAAVAEVFLVVRLLPDGHLTSLTDAFILETTGRLIAVVFKFVPYRLGVDEAGTGLVAAALSMDPTVGVTLALIRRLRIVFWNAIGLVVLAKSK